MEWEQLCSSGSRGSVEGTLPLHGGLFSAPARPGAEKVTPLQGCLLTQEKGRNIHTGAMVVLLPWAAQDWTASY